MKNIIVELRDRECYRDSVVLAEGEFGSLDGPALDYECEVTKKEGEYLLGIRYRVRMTLPCARCLKEAAYVDETEFEVLCTAEMPDDDTEEYVLRMIRGKVDISEPIMQEIELRMPLAHLCGEDCRGICPVCGTYRPCGCKSEAGNPFSILKEYFTNNKEE